MPLSHSDSTKWNAPTWPGELFTPPPQPTSLKGNYCEGIPLLKAKLRSIWLLQDYYTSNTYIHVWINYSGEL